MLEFTIITIIITIFIVLYDTTNPKEQKGIEAMLEEKHKAWAQKMAEARLQKEKEEAEQLLEEKMDRWVYLNDLNDRINNQ